ncbi:MAG: hypothetical protein QOG42_1386 [Solirubrobacteraceae bacterium]|jgi:hypothetical protein|nr:hypothetical protein [Solirubrobacteraceae bacterium]
MLRGRTSAARVHRLSLDGRSPTQSRMTRTLPLAVSLAVMLAVPAGCGGNAGPGAPAAPTPAGAAPAHSTAPSASPAPAPTGTSAPAQARTLADYAGAAKSDLRQAVSIIESYAMDNGGYTAALRAPALPATVTIVAVRPDGYGLTAGTADGATYTIERVGPTTSKRCAPLDRVFCQTGDW